MKAFKVNNLITPYKAHAFIVANGKTDLIKEVTTNEIEDQYWEVEDGELIFNWEVSGKNQNYKYKIDVETETEYQGGVDLVNNDTQDTELPNAVLEKAHIGELTYTSYEQIKTDFSPEVASEIILHIENYLQEENEKL